MSLEEALAKGIVALHTPLVTTASAEVDSVIAGLSDRPVLVTGHDGGELVMAPAGKGVRRDSALLANAGARP